MTMSKQNVSLLKRVQNIERDLQSIKLEVYKRAPAKQREAGLYRETDIINEIKRVRRKRSVTG